MLASFKSKISNVFCPAIFLHFRMVCSLSRMASDKMGYLEKMAKNQKICHPPSTTPYVYGFKKYHLIIGLISLQIQYCLFI